MNEALNTERFVFFQRTPPDGLRYIRAMFALPNGAMLGLWSRHTAAPAGEGKPGAGHSGIRRTVRPRSLLPSEAETR